MTRRRDLARLPAWALLWLLSCVLLSGCGGYADSAKSAPGYAGQGYGPAPAEAMRVSADSESDDGDYVEEYDFDDATLAREEGLNFAGEGAPAGGAMEPPQAQKVKPQTSPDTPTSKPTTAPDEEANGPLLIYTADFSLAVFEVRERIDEVEVLARELKGFLARRDDTSITIRVPAARFQEAVEKIESIGDVLNRNVTSEDVTEEFRDLEIQLKNSLAMRDRLAALLERAEKVEEALEVERELGRVTNEIERLKGRLKFLKDRIAFSTITVNFQTRASEIMDPRPVQLPLPWLHNLGLNRLLNL